jgi:WD40 repeat protein
MTFRLFLVSILIANISFSQINKLPLATLKGHKGAINSIDITNDGKYLVSASKDQTICVWDLQNFKLYKSIENLPSSAKIIKFNANTDKFLVGLYSSFSEYSFPSCRLLRKKKNAQEGFVETACYSNDQQNILTTGWREKTITIWHLKTLKKKVVFEEIQWTDNACFSANAESVLSGAHDNKVKIWDAKSGIVKKTFAGHDDWITKVLFSKDENMIYSSSLDKTIKIWSVESGKNIMTLKGHLDGVTAFDISSDGSILASVGLDKLVIIWDLKTNTVLNKFNAHDDAIYAVKFSLNGQQLYTASKDATIKIWNVNN